MARKNRYEVFIAPNDKRVFDNYHTSTDLNQGDALSQLLLSVTEEDVLEVKQQPNRLIDADISDDAHAHWEALQKKFGKHASKKKLLLIALSKLQ